MATYAVSPDGTLSIADSIDPDAGLWISAPTVLKTVQVGETTYAIVGAAGTDSLTVVDWLEGSYPNFFFVIDREDIEDFAEHYRSIQTRDDYEQFVARYGVRRSDENFWHHADWFHERYAREKPVLSGLFDLNRYRNR